MLDATGAPLSGKFEAGPAIRTKSQRWLYGKACGVSVASFRDAAELSSRD